MRFFVVVVIVLVCRFILIFSLFKVAFFSVIIGRRGMGLVRI